MEQLPIRLLLLLDSRSPAGAHGHSGGMEYAVTSGWVRDVTDIREFCNVRIATSGRIAAAAAAAACRLWHAAAGPRDWAILDREVSARTPSEAARAASRSLGNGLRRLLLATATGCDDQIAAAFSDCPQPAPHHPLVLGAATACVSADASTAARASLLATCNSAVTAAVRLLGIDPYQAHRVIAELAGDIERAADECAALPELPADCAPLLDLSADVHLHQEVRLFAS